MLRSLTFEGRLGEETMIQAGKLNYVVINSQKIAIFSPTPSHLTKSQDALKSSVTPSDLGQDMCLRESTPCSLDAVKRAASL